MKIILVTQGSRGDVQPLLALSLRLKSHGHDVIFVSSPENSNWVKSQAINFLPIGSNLEEARNKIGFTSSKKTLNDWKAILYLFCNEIQTQFSELPNYLDGADLVLAAGGTLALPSISEFLNIPYAFIALCPQYIPSSYHPFWCFPYQGLPGWANKNTWWLASQCFGICFSRTINSGRSRLGLKPCPIDYNYMFHGPILLATDPILGLIPSDINKRCLQTGYLHLDQGNQLDETLKAFITSGPPPVYVGFGSMIDKNVEMTNQIIADAAINANQRYIIAGRSTRHSGEQINDNCYLVNETPHSVLFPLVAAVVHHGGAGTTATSAMAGVPQVIVPHTQDQFYWGKRIFNLGLGPKPVPHKTLNSKVLSSAIRESLCNENIQRNVKTVSNIIHNQDSLENAVNYIESEFTINNAIN